MMRCTGFSATHHIGNYQHIIESILNKPVIPSAIPRRDGFFHSRGSLQTANPLYEAMSINVIP